MGGFFDARYATKVHILQIVLILVAMGVTGAKLLFFKSTNAAQSRSRANTMALGMGAKSLIFISYQLLTEHTKKFSKWASLKANMILNNLEVVFWGAVIYLVTQFNVQACTTSKGGCLLSWLTAATAILVTIVGCWAAICSTKEWRYFKANGVHRGSVDVENPKQGYHGGDRSGSRHSQKFAVGQEPTLTNHYELQEKEGGKMAPVYYSQQSKYAEMSVSALSEYGGSSQYSQPSQQSRPSQYSQPSQYSGHSERSQRSRY